MAEVTQYWWNAGKACPNSRELREVLLPMFDGPDEWIKILNQKSVLVGRGSKKATVVILDKGNLITVYPGRAGVQMLIAISVAIGYVAFLPGLILSFLVQVPYLKRHSEMTALACMGLIVGLNATPNDGGSKSSRLFDHVDPATWKQIEMEYHASKKKASGFQQQFDSQPPVINTPTNFPPPSPQISSQLFAPPENSPMPPPAFNTTPPPESWVGDLGDDGYEYIEYPDESGITYYRYQGESQWKKWDDGESQTSQIESTPMQSFLSAPIAPPPTFVPVQPPPGQPPPPLPNNPLTFAHSTTLGAPRRDNFAAMNSSSQFGRKKSRRGLKVAVGVIFVLGLLIILPSILYVWASDLAEESEQDSNWFDESNDSDSDGVDDDWDNCVYNYNPSQDDFDGDSYGDACDSDIDDDGYINSNDFYDYGDGVLMFKWTYARIDDSESYDGDESGPDVYAQLMVDWDSDDITDITYTSPTTNNIREWSNLWEKELNPNDNRDQIKFTVRLYDDDYGSDDVLDYVSGTYTSYTFTVNLYESKYDSNTYDGRDGKKGLKVTFIFDVDSSGN